MAYDDDQKVLTPPPPPPSPTWNYTSGPPPTTTVQPSWSYTSGSPTTAAPPRVPNPFLVAREAGRAEFEASLPEESKFTFPNPFAVFGAPAIAPPSPQSYLDPYKKVGFPPSDYVKPAPFVPAHPWAGSGHYRPLESSEGVPGPPQAIDVTGKSSLLPSLEGVPGPPQAIDVTPADFRAQGIKQAADRYRSLGPEASEKERAAAMADYRTALQQKGWADRAQAMADWRNQMDTRTDYERFLTQRGESALGAMGLGKMGGARVEAENKRVAEAQRKQKAGEELTPEDQAELDKLAVRQEKYARVPGIGQLESAAEKLQEIKMKAARLKMWGHGEDARNLLASVGALKATPSHEKMLRSVLEQQQGRQENLITKRSEEASAILAQAQADAQKKVAESEEEEVKVKKTKEEIEEERKRKRQAASAREAERVKRGAA